MPTLDLVNGVGPGIEVVPEEGDVRRTSWGEMQAYTSGTWCQMVPDFGSLQLDIVTLRDEVNFLEGKVRIHVMRNLELEDKYPELRDIGDLYRFVEAKLKTFEALKNE